MHRIHTVENDIQMRQLRQAPSCSLGYVCVCVRALSEVEGIVGMEMKASISH